MVDPVPNVNMIISEGIDTDATDCPDNSVE